MYLAWLLTLGAHAQEGYCVCLCVCLSVKSYLTSGASVRPENTVVYSASNGGQKMCWVFFETALPFQHSRTCSRIRGRADAKGCAL